MLATDLPYLPTVYIYAKGKKVYSITFPGFKENFQQEIAETIMSLKGFDSSDYNFSWNKPNPPKHIEDISAEYIEMIRFYSQFNQ